MSFPNGADGAAAYGSNTTTLSATASLTHTASVSATHSDSLTHTDTLTPTHSDSLTHTDTLTPTHSDSLTHTYSLTHTDTLTPTHSDSLTHTYSLTHTDTLTPTLTTSLPAVNNYTINVDPPRFEEGEEFRIKITSKLADAVQTATHKLFNLEETHSLSVRMYAWKSSYGVMCEKYTSETPLATRTQFGVSQAAVEKGLNYVDAAHVTFPAPSSQTPFIVCFNHNLNPNKYKTHKNIQNSWQLFTTDGGQAIFQSTAAKTWYYLPAPSVGQYAIIQLLTQETGYNFTYPPSSCSSAGSGRPAASCGLGDNLKIVPAGEPCTYEYQSLNTTYLGSLAVQADGSWSDAALDGLAEGATAGGVGAFGTQFANPLVDSWTSSGTYFASNYRVAGAVQPTGSEARHAYVYVRLPQTAGSYDVCFSSRERRIATRTNNVTLDSIPMWRKLQRCTTPKSCSSSGASFTAVAEEVGWSMVDLTAGTWGDIVFDDSGSKQMSTKAATSTSMTGTVSSNPHPLLSAATKNYWDPQGGDYFRIVASTSFTEKTTRGRAYPAFGAKAQGSFPSAGCWSQALDTAATTTSQGGFVDSEALYPIGSKDLTGDPTGASRDNDDATGLNMTHATLYVPTSGNWYVCYRRTCTYSGVTCAKHSGLRVAVLRFTPPTGAAKWKHLGPLNMWVGSPDNKNAWGTPDTQLLIPGMWNYTTAAGTPPAVTWYMNDTRTGTWGPIIVEKSSTTATEMLDSRPWNFRRTYASGDVVGNTVGSAVRIVPSSKPCDYPGFLDDLNNTPEPKGAESWNGGMVECESANAFVKSGGDWGCLGSASDVAQVSNVAYYIKVPALGSYRVCHRHHGFNWHSISASGEGGAWNDPKKPMPDSVLQRADWRGATTSVFSPAGAPTLSLTGVEHRAEMEALFLVSDTEGSLSVAPRKNCSGNCAASGDVMRLVPADQGCDINPTNWDGKLADTHLSLYCPVSGAGTTAQSGLLYTASSTTACSVSNPVSKICTPEAACSSNPYLSALVARTPAYYDDIVPRGHVYSNHKNVAGAIYLPQRPAAGGTTVYKVCYKQVGMANWVVFNNS